MNRPRANGKKWQFGFHSLLLIALVSLPLIEPKVTLNYKFYFIWFVVVSLLLALQKVDIRKADRAVISTFIFIMSLTGMSTYFMSQNPGLTNDTHRVTEWINQNKPAVNEVIIYNKRLPSVLFNSKLNVISVFDGDESLNRETQFQHDETWKTGLINLQQDSTWINEKAPNHSIWISKGRSKLPDLAGLGNWEELEVVDGWRISQFLRKD